MRGSTHFNQLLCFEKQQQGLIARPIKQRHINHPMRSIRLNLFRRKELLASALILVISSFQCRECFCFTSPNSLMIRRQMRQTNAPRQSSSSSDPIFYDDFGDLSDGSSGNVLVVPDLAQKTKEADDDWRLVRRNLVDSFSSSKKSSTTASVDDWWAHEISSPELGSLLIRMPLEVELYKRNWFAASDNVSSWFIRAQQFIEREMLTIADAADDEGQLNPSNLQSQSSELLSLYLDHQETWQEVCLVVDQAGSSVVLNRPMALQLTGALARLVLYGQRDHRPQSGTSVLDDFLRAFGSECAVYVGGPEAQDRPALWVHGHEELGGTPIGNGVYVGVRSVSQAVAGVLDGKYRSMDFKFFVGRHAEMMECPTKFQPVSCSRQVALKQCIQLPVPLWHQVLDLCGGELGEISTTEREKRDDLKFQIVDEDEEESLFDDEEDDDDLFSSGV